MANNTPGSGHQPASTYLASLTRDSGPPQGSITPGLVPMHDQDTVPTCPTPKKRHPTRLKLLDLPAEALTRICDHLTAAEHLSTARLICSEFEKAAWPSFARSFNHRLFHPTKCSLDNLKALSRVDSMKPYFTILHISTVTLREGGEAKLRAWVEKRLQRAPEYCGVFHAAHCLRNAVREYVLMTRTEKSIAEIELIKALESALEKLSNLEKIVVVDRREISKLWKFPSISMHGHLLMDHPDLLAADGRGKLFDLHNHRHTLQIVSEALWNASSRSRISSKFNALSTIGAMALDTLPAKESWSKNFCQPYIHFHLNVITRLDLSFARNVPADTMRGDARHWTKCLPSFLQTVPNLKSLRLTFPPTPGSSIPTDEAYGSKGFWYITTATWLPFLRNLEIRILTVRNPTCLIQFLSKHAQTLKVLSFYNLCVGYRELRPFLHFVQSSLALDEFNWHLQLTNAEWERQQELVADISKEDLVSTEEFIPMAKKVTMQYDGRGQVIRDDSRREPASGSA